MLYYCLYNFAFIRTFYLSPSIALKYPDVICCRYAVAESDCNLAIALDRKYVNAYSRRGAARFALKNHQGALEGESV